MQFIPFQIVIGVECRNIRKIYRKQSASSSLKTYHMLVANLAVADFLMGLYLLSLGIAGAAFEDFCGREIEWLSSVKCQFLGSLVVISSEASVITIIILTSCRLFAVLKVRKLAYDIVLFKVLATGTYSGHTRGGLKGYIQGCQSLLSIGGIICNFTPILPSFQHWGG